MEEVWVEAIAQYLNGAEWRGKVERFVDAKCVHFAGRRSGGGHAHENGDANGDGNGDGNGVFVSADEEAMHRRIFEEFRQDVVHESLETVLSALGANSEIFLQVAKRRMKEGHANSRDVRLILRKLVTYDSFETFAGMMYRRRLELDRRNEQSSSKTRERNAALSREDQGPREAHREPLREHTVGKLWESA